MTPREQGFLLLTGFLGDPDRKPLTIPQLRELTLRVRAMKKPVQSRDLTYEDLISIGCEHGGALRILQLLSEQDKLDRYLEGGRISGCYPVTRVSRQYPARLWDTLGPEAPGALWYQGDLSLLQMPAVSLVGSRDLLPQNELFAWEVGKQAARQGYVLISGNARGADRTAQDSCLAHGGKVISVVADTLSSHRESKDILYLSEDGYDQPFSSHRALRRNRIIHALGERVFVAQCRLGRGGTWQGTQQSLSKQWSPVFCCDDGSDAVRELAQRGATLITKEDLMDLTALSDENTSLFNA